MATPGVVGREVRNHDMCLRNARGETYQQIADVWGVSTSTVSKVLHRAAKSGAAEQAALQVPETDIVAMREAHQDKIDGYLAVLQATIDDGGKGANYAVDVSLRALGRAAKMWGLDSPERIEAVVAIDAVYTRVRAVIETLCPECRERALRILDV